MPHRWVRATGIAIEGEARSEDAGARDVPVGTAARGMATPRRRGRRRGAGDDARDDAREAAMSSRRLARGAADDERTR